MNIGVIALAHDVNGGKIRLVDSMTWEEPVISRDPYELLAHMVEDYQQDGGNTQYVKVVWDIDEFCAPVFKLMGEDICHRLMSNSHRVKMPPFTIFYMPGKFLGIDILREVGQTNTFRKDTLNIYDIHQYFPDVENPNKVQDVYSYGRYLLDTLKNMDMRPMRLTSPIRMYEECVLENMSVPTVYDMPNFEKNKEAVQYAMKCAGKEWRTVYQIGYWGLNECADYDVRSAYPAIIAQLRNTKYCRYEKSSDYIPDADWGFLRGKVRIDARVSPIIHPEYGNVIGEWEDYLTLDEVKWLEARGIGKFELYDGWFLTFTSYSMPFNNIMGRLFAQRHYGNLRERLSKKMANGLGGKFAEVYDNGEYGKYFNPFYHAIMTARCRLQVAEFIYKNELQDDVISVMVDGVLSSKKVQKKILGTVQMGGWRTNPSSSFLVVSVGNQYSYEKKSSSGISYEQIMESIGKHPNSNYYHIKKLHKVTLQEALERGDLSLLASSEIKESSLDLQFIETNLQYDKLPKNGRQLLRNRYRGEPRNISQEVAT